ncbi:hypothetical protein IFM89_035194 [Coptis chinensis]|uniref:Enhancer of polycomb-like protein n=1 Tax=Coptis chinensis TaxID=261450 RepID=A0A835IFZ7_9MAGN|nr:hypothetical protein IFM89_035194 [Coptis chinensis]
MESSLKGCDVDGNDENSRSLDIYVEKSEGLSDKGESSGLKRKGGSSESEESGLGQGRKKKRSLKEVSLSSFESVNKKKKNGLNLEQKERNDQLLDEGDLKSLLSLDANGVPIPKRPRCFIRRKKFQNNHLFKDVWHSEKVCSGDQLVKLNGQSATSVSSFQDNGTKVNDDFKENNSDGANSARKVKSKDTVSSGYNSKVAKRNRAKRREPKSQEQSGVDRLQSSVDKIATPRKNRRVDEESLEANAARMLISRFDPSCTGYSGNGLSFGSSTPGSLASSRSNRSVGLEDNSADAADRVLRPRMKDKQKRYTRKRRHFYEIFSRDVDAYWVINRRIKVFWPLDQSWYLGLITSYDTQRNLHHIKYDDRDEEWINLENERFKLLLLPGEAPRNADSETSGQAARTVVEEKEDAEVEDDNGVDIFMDTEPIISWLARSTRQVKSSPLTGVKRKMHPQSKDIGTSKVTEDSFSTLRGCLVNGTFKTGTSKLCCESVVPVNVDNEETSEAKCSNDGMLRFVYFRKRFRQRGQELSCTSKNSECRSIVVYDPHICSVGRPRRLKENDMANEFVGVDDFNSGCLSWFGKNLGLLKLTVTPINSRQVTLKFSIPLQFVNDTFRAENSWLFHTLLLLQYGVVMVMWPKVQLEMLFVDNVVGLRFLLFEGCLMQAVAFVCLVLLAFHQPDEHGEVLDRQVPVTSIRFEISGFPSFGRRFIFVLYNFVEVKNSKWLYLDKKLKRYCSVTKQLPLSECTYHNIKILQNRSYQPFPSVCREPVSPEVSRRRSRQGQGIMYTGISKESAYVDMSLSCSSCNKKPKRIPHFLLPFAAAPTFFLSLHLKLFMAKNVASFNFCNPMLLLEGPEDGGRLVAHDCSLDEDIPDQRNDCSLDEDIPDQRNFTNDMECSLSTAAAGSGSLSCVESKADDISLSNEGDLETFQKCLKNELTVAETLLGNQDSGKSMNNDIVELKSHSGHLSGSEQCAENSQPPVAGGHSFLENRGKECFSHLNDIKIQVPAVNHVESPSCDGERQEAQQFTSDSVWSVNDFAIRSPNPTAPRSLWHRNRHSSGSLSFGYRSKIWPDGTEELSPNGLVNGSSKPRNQASCLLPFGSYDFSSKPRSHQRRGPGRPRRIRTDIEKTVPKGSRSPQRRLELLSCYANLLSTAGDRGWRECGVHVVLERTDHNEWRLLVKLAGVTKHSYKAYQFFQPGTTNRYTHAMMWKGGKDWILEFPDRNQWTLFKEMHEECYNRNLHVVSVKTIPIPGVRLFEEINDNGVEIPFVRSSSKYFQQVETDVDMALNPSRVLYDMDTDDDEWIINRSGSSDASVSHIMEISEEMFERTMDTFEKVAYSQQCDDFTSDEIEDLLVGGEPIDVINDIYEYWKQKRQRKGMPLIRQLQPPMWERYQKQLKEWELSFSKVHHLSNGFKEKSVLLEKPPMFAFCLRPRGLEVPNKGSKHRSQRKVSAGGHSCASSRDFDAFGRKSNGFGCGEERFLSGSNHEYGSSWQTSSWQTSSRVISPRDAVSTGYLSMSSDGSERSQPKKLHRNKSKKIRTFTSHSDAQMIMPSYNQSPMGQRNGVSRWNVGVLEWPNQNPYQREVFSRNRVEKLGVPDLDEFRLRDASSAAQHASNMAKLKREKAQRLLYRADLAVHKAVVALMIVDSIKASSEDSSEDRTGILCAHGGPVSSEIRIDCGLNFSA